MRVDPAYEYATGLQHHLDIGGKKKTVRFPKRDQFAPELIYSDCIIKVKEARTFWRGRITGRTHHSRPLPLRSGAQAGKPGQRPTAKTSQHGSRDQSSTGAKAGISRRGRSVAGLNYGVDQEDVSMAEKEQDNSCATKDPAHGKTGRNPEDREVNEKAQQELREKMMDKTLADSYPASDPPSSIPDPAEDDSAA